MTKEEVMIVPKEWWRSKTIWSAVLGIAYGLAYGLAEAYGWDTRWAIPVGATLISLGAVGIRTASQPIGDPKAPQTAIPVVGSTEAVAVPAEPHNVTIHQVSRETEPDLPEDHEILPPEGVIQKRPFSEDDELPPPHQP